MRLRLARLGIKARKPAALLQRQCTKGAVAPQREASPRGQTSNSARIIDGPPDVELFIDIRWLLERKAELLPKHPYLHEFSRLVAAIGRHRVNTPQIGVTVDNACRAAALMHTVIRRRPLPARNALFGAGLVAA